MKIKQSINEQEMDMIVKSQCQNVSGISNQVREIEFWLIPPKQHFDITISRNDAKKSPNAVLLEKYTEVRKLAKNHNFN